MEEGYSIFILNKALSVMGFFFLYQISSIFIFLFCILSLAMTHESIMFVSQKKNTGRVQLKMRNRCG
jgi:hypothetical protein